MSQSEGQKKTASTLMQPLQKEKEIRFGLPEGMKERRTGDETHENESVAKIQRHQRTERIRLEYLEVGALETDLKHLKWLPPVK